MSVLRDFFGFFKDIYINKSLILRLSKKDFQSKHLGSYLGILWAFVHPALMILIYWFVFQVGFRSMPIGDIPFILWLLSGMVPWLFFSESVSGAANAVVDNSYLVKKVVFKVEILPVVKIISASFIHIFFVSILFLLLNLYDFPNTIYYLQYFYYLFATLVLVTGLTMVLSALIVFIKDVGQILNMILQFGFWLTPIFWSYDILPEKYQIFIKLNPLYYIVDGYRQTFLYHTWFWERPSLTIYFWGFCTVLLFVGVTLFKKLRPHFSDVL
ncbi:ABC transporter permease [Paenibacillus agilis]|uniref:Transport permease protein n=1 Tax=Paenibacillus agilis TaxID=3020863 RepID=A0A559IP32_9BACL|nr:ABC transporter permease [Paenibacillus agilis]TVX89409.1 ABC transporter permease [Paenibacillus agilis]